MNNISTSKLNMHKYNEFEKISDMKDFSMDNEWYNISDMNHFWPQWRLKVMLKQLKQIDLPINKELKVLEVGCGTGTLREEVECNTNWYVDAADLNIHALSHVKPGRGRTMLYDVCDEYDSFIGSYDVVILFDVLEHIKNTKPFIDSLLKHLKPGGALLINVPALQSFYSVYDKRMGHFRRYDKKTLSEEFNNFKLRVLNIQYWGLSMLPLLIIRSTVMGLLKKNERNIVQLGFRPPNNTINRMLKVIMTLETMIINHPLIGTSLLMACKKLP